jgi:hypothetical protein
MMPVIRISLILVLAMLQLFAPLVHGHTGNSSFNDGLHIPGLESYRLNEDAPVIQNVNVDWDAEGLLVMVDLGIKNPHDFAVETTGDHNYGQLPPSLRRMHSVPKEDNNFSPHKQLTANRKPPSSHSPRAPPSH